MDQNLSNVKVSSYGTYSQHHIKWGAGVSFDTFKNITKTCHDQPVNVVSVVCLQLDFLISMYSNLISYNCLSVLNWCCGLLWRTMHDCNFCFLDLSENSLCFHTANVVFVQFILYGFWSASQSEAMLGSPWERTWILSQCKPNAVHKMHLKMCSKWRPFFMPHFFKRVRMLPGCDAI